MLRANIIADCKGSPNPVVFIDPTSPMKPCKETALSNSETIHVDPSCSISQFAQLLQPITPAAGAGKESRIRPRKVLLAPSAKSIVSQCIGAGADSVSHRRDDFSRFSQFPHLISCQLSSFAYVAWSLMLWKRRIETTLNRLNDEVEERE